LGIRKGPDRNLAIWSLLCLAGAVATLVPFVGPNVMSYRWALLLDIPLCIFAAQGLVSLFQTKAGSLILRSCRLSISATVCLALVISGGLYLSLPAQQAFGYFGAFPELVPTSMMQSSVPASDIGDLNALLMWTGQNLDGNALITHQAFYGWARMYLPASAPIINYGFAAPSAGVQLAEALGYTSVLLIWWVNGSGWYGQRSLSESFHPIIVRGELALYSN